MKTLKWAWFLVILLLYSIPRVIYIIKFRLSEEPEGQGGYDAYSNLHKDVADLKNIKWWQV